MPGESLNILDVENGKWSYFSIEDSRLKIKCKCKLDNKDLLFMRIVKPGATTWQAKVMSDPATAILSSGRCRKYGGSENILV